MEGSAEYGNIRLSSARTWGKRRLFIISQIGKDSPSPKFRVLYSSPERKKKSSYCGRCARNHRALLGSFMRQKGSVPARA